MLGDYRDYGIGIGNTVIVTTKTYGHCEECGTVTYIEQDSDGVWVRVHFDNKGVYWFPIEDLKAIETKSK